LSIWVLEYEPHMAEKLGDALVSNVGVINRCRAFQSATEEVRHEAVEQVTKGRLPRAVGTGDEDVLSIVY
jgi:hypothetical protein